MPRYKRIASQCKDPLRFQSYHAEEKYEEFIEPRKIIEEKKVSIFKATHRNCAKNTQYCSKAWVVRVLQPPSRSCTASSQRILRQFGKPWSAQHLGKKHTCSIRLSSYECFL